MAGYINPDGQTRLVTEVFGNVSGRTVRAKSLWTNRDGVATCIYREGEREMYVVGLNAGEGNNVFPMAYSYDMDVFRACSITMPSGYESYKPVAISEIVYSKELGLFVALGYYLQKNYTSNSVLRWYMMHSEDGKNWEVSLMKTYTYYSVDFLIEYDAKNHLFLVANKGPSTSASASRFYFYSSVDGKNWTEVEAISPTNATNTKTYTAKDIKKLLAPGDGYIYLSGGTETMLYGGSSYYQFLRTEDGINYELFNELSQSEAGSLYGCRSLFYMDGVYYSLDEGMYITNPNSTSQSKDYYNVGIHASYDDMDTWEYIPLDVSPLAKAWSGSSYDGFFSVGSKLLCSISKKQNESYLYSSEDGETWVKEEVIDSILGRLYEYLYVPVSDYNLILINDKLYRTHGLRLSSTEDGVEYIEESTLSASMRAPFSLSSSNSYVIAVKNAN